MGIHGADWEAPNPEGHGGPGHFTYQTRRATASPPIYKPLTHSARDDGSLRLAMKTIIASALVSIFALGTNGAFAQTITHSHPSTHLLASHIIVPQTRAFAPNAGGTVTITEVNVAVDIVEQVATTTTCWVCVAGRRRTSRNQGRFVKDSVWDCLAIMGS